PLPVQRTILDLSPGEAGRIGRAAIERGLKRATALTRPIKRDLVIAGEQTAAVAIVAGEEWRERGLEKFPRGLVVAGRQFFGRGTKGAPLSRRAEIAAFGAAVERGSLGPGHHRRTRFQKRRDRSGDGIVTPTGKLFVLCRR